MVYCTKEQSFLLLVPHCRLLSRREDLQFLCAHLRELVDLLVVGADFPENHSIRESLRDVETPSPCTLPPAGA